MTDKEAIEIIEYARAFNEKQTKLMTALDMAISALQEREKRNYGCNICNTPLEEDVLVNTFKYKFCPHCGRPLKEES